MHSKAMIHTNFKLSSVHRSLAGGPLIWIFAVALLVPATTRLAAQSQLNQPQDATTYKVQGVVLNKISGQPIMRALVQSGGEAVFTDKSGNFSLPMRAGSGVLSVLRPGYVDKDSSSLHVITVTQNTPEQTIYLVPQTEISGWVTVLGGHLDDLGGINTRRLRFEVYKWTTFNHKSLWMGVKTARPDDEGKFKVQDLEAPASYKICNHPQMLESHGTKPGEVEYGFPSRCFPGGESFAASTSLLLHAGQKTNLEIPVTAQPFYQVTLDKNNLPSDAVAMPHLYGEDGSSVVNLMEQKSGQVITKLPNGSYTLKITAHSKFTKDNASKASYFYAQADFTVRDGPLSDIKLNFQPMNPLMAEIRREFTAKVEGNDKYSIFHKILGPVTIYMLPVSNRADYVVPQILQRAPGANNENRYVVSNLIPGRYWLRASTLPASNYYISSITSGGHDLNESPLTVGPEATEPIEIVLRNDGGEILCTVNDPEAAPNGKKNEIRRHFVYVVPLSSGAKASMPDARHPLSIQENGVSYLRYPQLAPGSYRVVAYDTPQEYDITEADSLSRLAEHGKTVTVTAGSKLTVQVDLIHTNPTEGKR